MAKIYVKNTDGTYTPQSSVLVSNLDIVQDKGDSLTSAMSQKAVTDELKGKQDTINDLDAIRQGAEKGSTALQSESDPIYTADKPNLALKSELNGKVDKEEGKGLSSNDYTDAEKAKLTELVTNAPDEEDITTDESNLLKFANRGTLHGMGYVILRKDKTFAEQVTQVNTIYEIRYHFDLNSGTVIIPEGCTLKFNGGTLDNGCLVGTHTNIDAENTNIFGENIALSQCAFFQKTNDVNEVKSILPWINLSTKRVECKNSANRSWKVKTSGAVSFSNADGLGQFVPLVNEEYLDIETEMRLSNNPGFFKPMNNGSTIIPLQFSGAESGNYLVLFNAVKENDGNTFIVPHSDRFVFFNSNDAGDNPNDTVLAPGTEIDLTQTTVYVAYLGVAYFDLASSTWECDAKLEWFISDYSGGFSLGRSQSRRLQNALDCPMNIRSGINGAIRCDNPLYAMVSKKIDLGGLFDFTGMDFFRSNAKFKAGYNLKGTAICCTTDINLLYIRNKIDLYGGAFIAEFASSHTKSMLILDGSYNASYSHIKTSILGKGYSTYCGILADYYEKDTAYNSFSEIECYVARCRYSLRSVIKRTQSYINSQVVRLICNSYAEAVCIESGAFGASEFYLMLQDGAIVPIADVDNYVHFRIESDRCSITAIPWDWSSAKTTAEYQKPYKAPVISGNNVLLTGTSGTSSNSWMQNYLHPGFAGHDPKVYYGIGLGHRFFHPYIGNSLAYFSNQAESLNSSQCYLSKFKVSTLGFNVDTYDDILKGNANVTEMTTSASIYSLIGLIGPGGFVTGISLDAEQFVEIVLEAKPNFTFDNSKLWKEFALVFINNPWKRAKLICWKGSTKYKTTFDLSQGLYTKGSINLSPGITKICLRLYGDASNNYGVGQTISSAQVIPQIIGYSVNLNDNYWASHYQRIMAIPTSSRPTKECFQGMMIYDKTLQKPIWYKGNGVWVDATGTSV